MINLSDTFKHKIPLWVVFIFLNITGILLYATSFDDPIYFDTAFMFRSKNLSDHLMSFGLLENRSLSMFSFGLVHQIFGESWYFQRVFNVLIHICNSVLLFGFLNLVFKKILKLKPIHENINNSWIAFFAAVIFLIHPVSVYATAYLVQRTILMGTGFTLVFLMLFIQGVQKNHKFKLLLSVVAFFCAVHSKENCMMSPAIAVVLLYIQDPQKIKAHLLRYSWVFLLCGAIIIQLFYNKFGLVGTVYEPYAPVLVSLFETQSQNALQKEHIYLLSLITQANMFFRYLLVWIVPIPNLMSIDLNYPFSATLMSWPESLFAILFLLYAAVSVFLVSRPGILKVLGLTLISPLLLFITEFSVVRISEQYVLYRSYFWMAFLGLSSPIIFKLLKNKKVLFATVSIYSIFLITVSYGRIQTFNSEITLWEDALSKTHLNEDGSLNFKNHRIYNNLGMFYLKENNYKKALENFKRLKEISPNNFGNIYNIGVAYDELGAIDDAVQAYLAAIKIKPDYADACNNLGTLYFRQKKYDLALKYLELALRYNLSTGIAHYNIGTIYLKRKNPQKALIHFETAKKLGLKEKALFNNIGMSYEQLNQFKDAIKAYELALPEKNSTKRLEFLKSIEQLSQ